MLTNMFQSKYLLIFTLFVVSFIYNSVCWAVGPFDYRDPAAKKNWLGNVEGNHFNKDVEQLIGGIASTTGPFNDLAYTLRVFPNHPRALNSMARYLRQGSNAVIYKTTADLYFEKAIEFVGNDATVFHLYAIHLQKMGKLNESLKNYKLALKFMPADPETIYNMGLLYVKLGQYDKALDNAKQVYQPGFLLPGLKNKLIRLGVWKD